MEKKNLLLLHGALGSQFQWDPLREKLATDFIIFTLNLRGHGGTPVPESFCIEDFTTDVRTFLKDHDISCVSIFGYSMGGYVALQLARDYPDLVDRIMTLGTMFDWTPETAAREVSMMNPEVIEQKIPAFAESLRKRHAPDDWKKLMRVTASMMTAMGNGMAMQEHDFRHISHRSLLCIGSADHMVSRAETERTAAWLPHGACKIMYGFRHPLESADPEVLAGVIKDFFLYI